MGNLNYAWVAWGILNRKCKVSNLNDLIFKKFKCPSFARVGKGDVEVSS